MTSLGQQRIHTGQALVGQALVALSLGVGACQRTPPRLGEQALADCRAAHERQSDSRIHIDGPLMSKPHLGDSVIYIVNDREVWRGVYDPCHPAPGRRAALDHAIPATDSVVSLVIEHGPNAAARYHVGGTRVMAYVIRTAPPPE